MDSTSPPVVGLVPWLPWPFSHWPSWAAPVRAERLALLRIGIALCLIADIGLNSAPETLNYYAKGSLGDPAVNESWFRSPRTHWSLLRGVGDPAFRFLSGGIGVAAACWIIGTSLAGLLFERSHAPAIDRTGIALWVWNAASILYTAGLWSDTFARGNERDLLLWAVPLGAFCLAGVFCGLELLGRRRDATQQVLWLPLGFALVVPLALMIVGLLPAPTEDIDKSAWWLALLRPWQDDATLLAAAMCLWIGSAFLLLIGCATRLAAVLTWMFSVSFSNANPSLENAGDTIRLIVLFYLMLCPCGAVWSIDGLRRKSNQPVLVHPWPIRLLFVQLMLIYFMNGLYKLSGSAWLEGSSLHYVLGDFSLSRFSATALSLPYPLTQGMTWAVMTWEVSFPLLVLWKWPRRFALIFGVLFHLGILATMELGFFAPYALCMYLPLVPWEVPDRKRENGV